MEFDTGIKLEPAGHLMVTSDQDQESFLKSLSDILRAQGREVGDSRAGEFWLDYSTPLQTRHLVVNAEQADSGYRISVRCGKRPGRISDVLLMGLALLALWLLGKVFTVTPQPLHIAGLILTVIAAAVLAGYVYGKTFGRKEATLLLEQVDRLNRK